MNVENIQPIPNEPALFIQDKKILVIADLHIGIESELRQQGVNAESQIQKMMDHLTLLCKNFKPKEIIILGDIKHNIPFSTKPERRDVKNFINSIQKLGIIHLTPGNHDGNIKKLASDEIIIHPSDGIVIENIGFVHGHRWPNTELMSSDMIIFGHTHPTIMIKDRLEYKTFEPCWLKGNFLKNKLKEKYPDSKEPKFLIIPAFNPLCGGIAINKDGINGPFSKIIDLENSEVFLLDGVSLGKIKNLI